jgi:hypothetical protein
MGPGIHHAPDKRLHVRLQPTDNHVLGITDYAGETDPNNVGLSVSRETTGALTVSECHNLIVRDLTLRFGGRTLQVRSSGNVTFDRVRIFAGPNGVFMGDSEHGSTGTVFSNCTLDGGIPPGASARTRRAGTGTDSTRIRLVMSSTRWPKEQVAV